jgi:opine dehydrogenase
MSLAALYLAELLRKRGVTTPIAALGTTVTTGRQTGPDGVNVGSVRARLDVAVLPQSAAARGLEACRELFGDRFVPRQGLPAIALSNLNAQNHLAIAMCNLTRMELGEAWGQNRHITPAVARLIEALDAERLAIATAFGVEVRTIHEHFHLSFHVPMGPLAEMTHALAQRPGDVKGPTTLDSRYVTEDVPFGLVPTIRLAALAGVPVPLHEGGVRLMSALYGRDFAAENDILPQLGALSREMLTELG